MIEKTFQDKKQLQLMELDGKALEKLPCLFFSLAVVIRNKVKIGFL